MATLLSHTKLMFCYGSLHPKCIHFVGVYSIFGSVSETVVFIWYQLRTAADLDVLCYFRKSCLPISVIQTCTASFTSSFPSFKSTVNSLASTEQLEKLTESLDGFIQYPCQVLAHSNALSDHEIEGGRALLQDIVQHSWTPVHDCCTMSWLLQKIWW